MDVTNLDMKVVELVLRCGAIIASLLVAFKWKLFEAHVIYFMSNCIAIPFFIYNDLNYLAIGYTAFLISSGIGMVTYGREKRSRRAETSASAEDCPLKMGSSNEQSNKPVIQPSS